MKIICLGPAFPLRGGIANFNTALCRSLLEAGHEASIVSFSLQYPGFLFPGKTQFETGEAPTEPTILPLINSVNPFSWIRSYRKIRAGKPDLLVIHHWMPFTAVSLGFIARRLRRHTRIIAVCHNVVPHEKIPAWKMLTRYFLRACHGYVVLSRSVLEDLTLFTSNTLKTFVPHPVYDIFGEGIPREQAAAELNLDAVAKYLLFFGVVRPYKGLDLMIRAFAMVREKIPDLKLIVAGEIYTGKEEYLRLIEESGLGDVVFLRDEHIPTGEVKNYFSLADLVTQPYRSATQSGVSQIAYHFGVPMLVTDVGGLAEIVPDGKVGYVVPVDEAAIAGAIEDFFTNDRAGEFRSAIREERKRFSWEALCDQIIEMAGRI